MIGEEVFRLTSAGRTFERDTITDFSLADGDKIDLSGIDAIAGGDDDAFTFVAKFTKQAGQATLVASGANTILRLDVDGDGKADHEIMFLNLHLTAGDNAWTSDPGGRLTGIRARFFLSRQACAPD